MSDIGHTSRVVVAEAVDGRVARKERNVTSVLDVVMEMFAEESLFPTMEEAAKRSGLSLRSLYRYFADPGELLEAALMRSWQRGAEAAHLHAVGQGSLEHRIATFVTMRQRIYNVTGSVWPATVANAARHPRIGEELASTRVQLRDQFARHFEPELAKLDAGDRETLLTAGDLATHPGAVDFLRRVRGLSEDETQAVLTLSLRSLFEHSA